MKNWLPRAFLLRTIFASLARANECVHVRNERDFPQAKLDFRIIRNNHKNTEEI